MELVLEELSKELQRQKVNSKDVVVDSKKIYARPRSVMEKTPGGNGLILRIPEPVGGGDELPKGYALTEWAHSQLAEKTGIPTKYYNRMLESGRYDLLAKNVNAWIHGKERRLIRILDGKVRAILGDRYRPMDNFDLLFCALDEFKKHGVDIHRCDLTETRMYVKVIQPHEVREIKKDDKVVPGLILSNSEVGSGKFKVEPFMLRLICDNGLIGEEVISKIHVGERRDVGNIWSDETHRKKDEAFWSEVKDVIKATFDPTVFNEWVEKLKRGTEVEVESPTTAVDNIAAQYNITDEKKKDLLDFFTTQEDPNQWGLANAITRMAQNEEKAENQVDFEKAGNDIAILEPEEFKRLTRKKGKGYTQ
jgi:hypothetical protein